MKFVGPHVSIAGGVSQAPLNAYALGATAFGMFTKNQRQWRSPPLHAEEIARFKENMRACGYSSERVIVHDSYLINLGNPEREKRDRAAAAFVDEAHRVEALGLRYLNFHPGSHLGVSTPKECIAHIASGIDRALSETEKVMFLLETTAGQRSTMGSRFEELAAIIASVHHRERVGVCIDTCHIFAAGYDIRTANEYASTMEAFDREVGLSSLRGWHINDSKGELGKKLDRHASLAKGALGPEPFSFLMKDDRLEGLPFVLETIDPSLWEEEIAWLKTLMT